MCDINFRVRTLECQRLFMKSASFFVMKLLACGAAMLVLVQPAQAQNVAVTEEGAQIEQRFIEPETPLSAAPIPAIKLESTQAPEQADKILLTVKDLRFAGNTIYSHDDLGQLAADLTGHEITLSQVYALAEAITQKYGADGYTLSRATVPPQELEPSGASVTIDITEGYIDRVIWPEGLAKYRDFFSRYSSKITAQKPINTKTLERYLLLANDLPGLKITSTLQPSADVPGASTLVISLDEEKPFDLFLSIDDRGTEGRGPEQYNSTATANNMLKQHEAVSVGYAGAFDTKEMQYVSLAYGQMLSAEGLKLELEGSYNTGEPGTDALAQIEFESWGSSFSAGLSYPVIRTRTQNLAVSGEVFAKNTKSNILQSRNSEDRLRGVRLSANYDQWDKWKGITQVLLTYSQGIDGLGSTDNNNPLASRSNGQVDFRKTEIFLARTQQFTDPLSLRMQVAGQYAFDPLLAPEECTYGGVSFGRAFDPSALAGDHCIKASASLRFAPEIAKNPLDKTQFYVFADMGEVRRKEPAAGRDKHDNGASVGAGVNVGWNGLDGAFEVARRLRDTGDNDWRSFFALSYRY